MKLLSNIKVKLGAAVIAAFLMTPTVLAQEFTGDVKYACEAVLCLSSSTRPGECSPALNRFFSIKFKRIDKTIKERLNFLKLCPDGGLTSDPELESFVEALSQGGGRCEAAKLNKDLRWCSGYSKRQTGKVMTGNVLPDYCRALQTHSYTALSEPKYVGDDLKHGYWVEAANYDRELANYTERMAQLGDNNTGKNCYRRW